MCDIHAVVFVTSHILLYVLMHDDISTKPTTYKGLILLI